MLMLAALFLVVSSLGYCPTLKMETVCCSETSVVFYQTTRENNNFQ
jgi:hypothetical protein